MKSETRLDSAVFQLTPTRTRYDLVIRANGKTEKIASGLLDPFLSHLKTAKDQIAKGGYSITLEVGSENDDATWFTKGTVERFVRFVSTPEVLERVNTIESEILQIDDAIAIQSNESLGCSAVEVHQMRSTDSIGGRKPLLDADADKAIVLFKPGVDQSESNGSTTHEENSKVQLLKVLETRKTVLQKEQGMAFARAVAAGFDMDHMTHIMLFAECFGATRLMDACLNFMELWKKKHETGQWVEVEAADATSSRSDFSSMNPSVIIPSGEARKQEFKEACPEFPGPSETESNGKMTTDADKRNPMDSQVPLSPQEYFHGQFPHPIYPHWPIHSPPGPPGAPVFQAYPMQGIPYYQNYPGSGPFFQTPYSPMDDPRFIATQRNGQNKHSVDPKNHSVNSGALEIADSNGRSPDGTDQSLSDLEKEALPWRKGGQSGKKQSRMVVIRNINYITSKKHDTSGSDSSSVSEPKTDEEAEDSNDVERKHKNSSSSKGKANWTKSYDTDNLTDGGGTGYRQETDVSNWQAFQNCLLRVGADKVHGDIDMFSEKEVPAKNHLGIAGGDPILPGQDSANVPDQKMFDLHALSGKEPRMYKERASVDESVISYVKRHPNDKGSKHSQLDVQLPEIERGRRGYGKGSNDDFMVYERTNQPDIMNFHTDNLKGKDIACAHKLDNGSTHNVADESFIVPLRSSSQDQVGTGCRTAIDMDSEFPSALQRTENSDRVGSQPNYEPDDLNLIPERGIERESFGYDPAADYEMQGHAKKTTVLEGKNQGVGTSAKQGSKKLDKEKKLRMQDALEKRKMGSIARKGKASKLTPPAEAQARAERLRAFKADLQKMKKEKEEEEIKRLEALKRERQRRIAARSSSSAAQMPVQSQQTRSRLPAKLSPGLQKGSKFSDSEPGSSSPLQRLPVRRASVGSNDSPKTSKPSSSNSARLIGSGLSRSVSSLQELKKENVLSLTESPEPKAVSLRTRTLSDPKSSSSHHASLLKSGSNNPVTKKSLSDEPEVKNITAIMNLDRTKSATLPELKIRTSRGDLEMAQKKSAMKEIMQKGNGSKSSTASESVNLKKSNEKTLHPGSHANDNPVVEKTVLTVEHETHPIPVVQTSEGKKETEKGSLDDGLRDKDGVAARNQCDDRRASPVIFHGVGQDLIKCRLDEKSNFHEMQAARTCARDELPKSPEISVAEKQYQAPYARASSLEDPCTRNLEYSKAPPIISDMKGSTVKAHVSNFTEGKSLEQIPEAVEKPQDKESSKGFKRFLNFGRKSHTLAAGDRGYNSEKSDIEVVDDQAAVPSCREVHTLKNLISQDDSSSVGTPHKVSRHFSLLSPFRTKTNEKKLAT